MEPAIQAMLTNLEIWEKFFVMPNEMILTKVSKVQLFWKGYKNLKKSFSCFDKSADFLSKHQNEREISFNFVAFSQCLYLRSNLGSLSNPLTFLYKEVHGAEFVVTFSSRSQVVIKWCLFPFKKRYWVKKIIIWVKYGIFFTQLMMFSLQK